MSDDDASRKLADLKARLDARRPAAEKGRRETHTSMWAKGARFGGDFLGGILVGAMLGLGFDHLVGTAPFGMMVGLLFGFAASILNMIRSVRALQEQSESRDAQSSMGRDRLADVNDET